MRSLYRKFRFPCLFILILFIVSACHDKIRQESQLLIVTTIYPYELIVKQLSLEETRVESIIPPNMSPHSYSPKPEDIKLLEDADLIISNGADLEVYLNKTLRVLSDKHLEVFSLIKNSVEKDFPGQYQTRDAHHNRINPHFWLDPVLASRIGAGITELLMRTDPENSDVYQKKLKNYREELNELHFLISEENSGKVSILNFHDSFFYFNNRYGIHSAGVIVRSPGKEPTIQELTKIGEIIREQEIKAILIEPQLDPKTAEVIAEEFGLSLAMVDPIGNREEFSTIKELILFNWNRLKDTCK